MRTDAEAMEMSRAVLLFSVTLVRRFSFRIARSELSIQSATRWPQVSWVVSVCHRRWWALVSKDESRVVEVIREVVDWWCVALTTS